MRMCVKGVRDSIIICAVMGISFVVGISSLFFGNEKYLLVYMAMLTIILVVGVAIHKIGFSKTLLSLWLVLIIFSPEFIYKSFEYKNIELRLSDIFLIGIFLLMLSLFFLRQISLKPIPKFLWVYILIYVWGIIYTNLSCCSNQVLGTLIGVKFVQYSVIFLVSSNFVDTYETAKYVKRFSIFLFLIVGISLLYQGISGNYWNIAGENRAIIPFSQGTGPSAQVVVIGLFIVFSSFAYSAETFYRYFLACVIVVIFVGLILTGSRGPMAGFVFSLLVVHFVYSRQRRLYNVQTEVILILVAMLVFLIIAMNHVKSVRRFMFLFSVLNPHALLQETGLRARTSVWRLSMKHFAQSPIFGYGLGFKYSVDNYYISILVNMGIIGMMATSLFFYILIRYLFLIRRSHHIFLSEMSLALGGITLGFLINGITAESFRPTRPMELYWYFLGILWGAHSLLPNSAPKKIIYHNNKRAR